MLKKILQNIENLENENIAKTEQLKRKVFDFEEETNQKIEINSQKLDILNQKTDVGSEKLEVLCLKTDADSEKLEVINQKIDTDGHKLDEMNQKAEMFGQRLDVMGEILNESEQRLLAVDHKMDAAVERMCMETRQSFEAIASIYNAAVQNLSQLNERLVEQKPSLNNTMSQDLNKDFGKALMKSKWALIDKYYREPEVFQCGICGSQIYTAANEKFQSKDLFQGGTLIRYCCPGCGAIAGPAKMLELTQEELGEEYRLHYALYEEGDTTDAEIETFYALKPEKGKKYLNYGCGAWTKTIPKLREAGFDVWGYEPYAPAHSAYIYNSPDQLGDGQFDGVFSHDLLEHLKDPVATFEEFKRLLADGGKMAHATACYKYVYEYTRFHLYFYTGNSVETICERIGLKLIDQIENFLNLYYCCVFEKSTD